MLNGNARSRKQPYTQAINRNASKEETVQQLQVSRDDLIKAIRKATHRLIHNEIYTDTLWKLLQLEYILSNLYIRKE